MVAHRDDARRGVPPDFEQVRHSVPERLPHLVLNVLVNLRSPQRSSSLQSTVATRVDKRWVGRDHHGIMACPARLSRLSERVANLNLKRYCFVSLLVIGLGRSIVCKCHASLIDLTPAWRLKIELLGNAVTHGTGRAIGPPPLVAEKTAHWHKVPIATNRKWRFKVLGFEECKMLLKPEHIGRSSGLGDSKI